MVKKVIEFGGIADADLNNPVGYGVLAYKSWIVLECIVGGKDFAGDRRIEVGGGFDAFDGAEFFAFDYIIAFEWHVYIYYIAQLCGGEPSHAYLTGNMLVYWQWEDDAPPPGALSAWRIDLDTMERLPVFTDIPATAMFADEDARRKLNSIVHPAVMAESRAQIENARASGVKVCILDVPLLFETGMEKLCDETWLISLDRATQAERLMARDGMTREQAEARIDSQMPLEEKERRATVVVDNRRSVEKLNSEVGSLYQALKKRIERMENE